MREHHSVERESTAKKDGKFLEDISGIHMISVIEFRSVMPGNELVARNTVSRRDAGHHGGLAICRIDSGQDTVASATYLQRTETQKYVAHRWRGLQ